MPLAHVIVLFLPEWSNWMIDNTRPRSSSTTGKRRSCTRVITLVNPVANCAPQLILVIGLLLVGSFAVITRFSMRWQSLSKGVFLSVPASMPSKYVFATRINSARGRRSEGVSA